MEDVYFIVNEVQIAADGTPAILSNVYADRSKTTKQRRREAMTRYHQILEYAYQTTLLFHGAYFMSSDGLEMMSEVVDNREEAGNANAST